MSIMTKFRLDGRTALVTGSSNPFGIGYAIAMGLAECGARVALHDIEPAGPIERALAAVREVSPQSIAVTGDLRRPDVPTRIITEAVAGLGSLDILVTSAAISRALKSWAEITQEEAEEQMQVNFLATLRMIQAVVPGMREKRWGRIVTIGSIQQRHPHPELAVYAAAKAAQENLARNLAAQLGPDGITVNNLAPGLTLTTEGPKGRLADEAYASAVRALIPVGFFGKADDMVGAALLLCSEAGRYITGSEIRVDGGRTASLLTAAPKG